MEKKFKKLKFDLLLYRHIYLIYAIVIAISIGFLVNAVINGHKTWYLVFESAIVVLLIFIAIFRLPGERWNIKEKSDVFLISLKTLNASMKTRITKLMVLENEFDVLKEKKEGISLIQERILNIHVTTIDESFRAAQEIGAKFDEAFMIPSSIPELYKFIQDMKKSAENEQSEITLMINKINELAEKF